MNGLMAGFTDDELWEEVLRRQLVIEIGFVNPDIIIGDGPTTGHILWERNWRNRWPVYGLRGGDTINPLEIVSVAASDE